MDGAAPRVRVVTSANLATGLIVLLLGCGEHRDRPVDAGGDSGADVNQPEDAATDVQGQDVGPIRPVDGQCPERLTVCDTDAGAVCVDLMSDNCHCGLCNTICDCLRGQCVGDCAMDQWPCGPTECTPDPSLSCRDLATDETNCGACGHACGPEQVCDEGECFDLSPRE